jgi:hypothetical protein
MTGAILPQHDTAKAFMPAIAALRADLADLEQETTALRHRKLPFWERITRSPRRPRSPIDN